MLRRGAQHCRPPTNHRRAYSKPACGSNFAARATACLKQWRGPILGAAAAIAVYHFAPGCETDITASPSSPRSDIWSGAATATVGVGAYFVRKLARHPKFELRFAPETTSLNLDYPGPWYCPTTLYNLKDFTKQRSLPTSQNGVYNVKLAFVNVPGLFRNCKFLLPHATDVKAVLAHSLPLKDVSLTRRDGPQVMREKLDGTKEIVMPPRSSVNSVKEVLFSNRPTVTFAGNVPGWDYTLLPEDAMRYHSGKDWHVTDTMPAGFALLFDLSFTLESVPTEGNISITCFAWCKETNSYSNISKCEFTVK